MQCAESCVTEGFAHLWLTHQTLSVSHFSRDLTCGLLDVRWCKEAVSFAVPDELIGGTPIYKELTLLLKYCKIYAIWEASTDSWIVYTLYTPQKRVMAFCFVVLFSSPHFQRAMFVIFSRVKSPKGKKVHSTSGQNRRSWSFTVLTKVFLEVSILDPSFLTK